MQIHQRKAGVILTYVSLVLSTAISILYTPIMLKLLGQAEYGLYQLAFSVVAYLGLLTFGFGSSYVRYYSKFKVAEDEKAIAKLNGMYLTVFSILGLIAFLAGLVLANNIHNIFDAKLSLEEIETAKILIYILVFNISLSFPFSVFNSYITANEKYFFQRILDLLRTITSPLLSLPILLMGYGSIGLVVVATSINISIELSYLFYCVKKLNYKTDFKSFDFSLLKEIAVFSFFIFINIIVDNINWNVDKFLLGMYQGTTAIAVYSIASQLNNYYLTFSMAISSVLVPRVNQLVFQENSHNELNELFQRVGRLQFILLSLILTGLYVFGQSFIQLWIGDNYSQSYYIMLILVTPVTIPLIQTLGIEIQRAKNLHRFRAYLYLGIALGNVLISIPLTKAYSGIGSATGTAIALFIANGIIMNFYYHKKCGLDVIKFWKEILKFIPALIVPIIAGIYICNSLLIDTWMLLFTYILLYVCLFGLSMWFISFNQYEKDLCLSGIRKVASRMKK